MQKITFLRWSKTATRGVEIYHINIDEYRLRKGLEGSLEKHGYYAGEVTVNTKGGDIRIVCTSLYPFTEDEVKRNVAHYLLEKERQREIQTRI